MSYPYGGYGPPQDYQGGYGAPPGGYDMGPPQGFGIGAPPPDYGMGAPGGFGAPPQGETYDTRNCPPGAAGVQTPPGGYSSPAMGYGGYPMGPPQGYGMGPSGQGYGAPSQGYGAPSQGYGAPPQGYGAPPQDMGGAAPGVYGQMGYPPQGAAPSPQMAYGGGYGGGYGGQFQPSACTGRKKAVLIGINYTRSARPLRGCINDVHNIKKFITERFGFRDSPDSMIVLTDDQRDPNKRPTKINMLRAMQWLVGGAQPGDSLFLHFSGHGGQVRDTDGDEDDGFDETILPEDYQSAGQLVDDDLHKILVKHLPPGVRLTVIFDSCHSGTAMDLPYVYNETGCIESPGMMTGKKAKKQAKKKMKKMKMKKMKEGKGKGKHPTGAVGGGPNFSGQHSKESQADVIMFSGCRDNQTAADTSFSGVGQTGAMSYAFISVMTKNQNITYNNLLQQMRYTLNSGHGGRVFTQVPQMSTGRAMDMNQTFLM